MRSRFVWMGSIPRLTLPVFTAVILFVTGAAPLRAQPAVAKRPGDAAQEPAPPERRVFIPYRNWSTLLKDDDPSIFLPLSRYHELLKLAEKGRSAAAQPPTVSAVITEAHYTATVEKGFARIKAALKVEALAEGWSDVPLPFTGAAVGKLTSTDGQALLRGAGKSGFVLMVPRKGTHDVTLELTAKVDEGPEGQSFSIGCPSVGISTLELTIPESGQSVTVMPELVALPVDAAAQATRVKAGLGATSRISARWRPKAAPQVAVKSLATVRNLTRVRVQSDLILTDAQLEYEVLRGALKQLRVAVPLDHQIVDVSGPAAKVTGWTAEKEDKRQVVTVSLSEPLSGRLVLDVHTESPRSAGKGPAADALLLAGVDAEGRARGVHALDVARENGFLILEHDETISLTVERRPGWTQAKAEDVPKAHRRGNALYYRFYGTKTALKVSAHPVQPRIAVNQDAQFTFDEDGVRLSAQLDYTITRIGLFELSLNVPAGLKIDNVVAAGLKSFRVVEENGVNVLKVAFDRKLIGQARITITGRHDVPAGEFGKPRNAPLPEPVNAERETGRIRLLAPTSLAVIVDQQGSTGVFPARKKAAAVPAGTRLVSAWEYQDRPVRLRIRVERVPPRVTARVGTALNVEQTATRVTTRLEFNVEHSPVGVFRFLVPKSVVAGLRVLDARGQAVPLRLSDPVKPKAVKQAKAKPAARPQNGKNGEAKAVKKVVAGPAADDLNDWKVAAIELPKPVVGRNLFVVEYELAAGNEADNVQREATIRPLRVLGAVALSGDASAAAVAELHGEVSVSGDRAFKIQSSAEGADVETIDAREIEVVRKVDGEFYRYHQEPLRITLKATKLDIQPVVETVVSKALVELLIGRDRTATYRCRYRLTSSERQRLRIDLPKTADPLAVLVDGRKVDLERTVEASEQEEYASYLVSVAREQSSNQSFSLLLQFVLPIEPQPFESPFGKLRLFLPKIGGSGESAAVVQQLRTAVWLPREYALIGETENFQRQTWTRLTGVLPEQFVGDTTPDRHENWIKVDPGGFDFPTQGHAYHYENLGGSDSIEVGYARLGFATWVLSIPLLLIGWVLARTSWENKLGVLLLITFAATMLSLKDIDWVYHGLFVARYGLAVMVGWWLIHSALGTQTPTPESPPAKTGGPPIGIYSSVSTAVIPPPGVFTDAMRPFRKPDAGGSEAGRD